MTCTMFYSQHPYTGTRFLERPPISDNEALALVHRVAEGALAWAKTPVAGRMEALRRLADALRKSRHRLALLAAQEMGKPVTQGLAEVDKCIRLCSEFADRSPAWLAGREVVEPDLNARVFYQPLGTVLGVMPWNFPYWQSLRFAVPALAAGNSVLLKPAPQMLRASEELQTVLDEAMPFSGICSHLFVHVDQLALILDTGLIQGVALTGSEQAGASFSALASCRLIPSVLELGGSDAMIVLPDAQLDLAARIAVRSRMANNGQACIAAKRILVHARVADAFVRHFIAEVSPLRYGPPEESNSFFSCMAREDLALQVKEQRMEALDSGARLLWECPVPRSVASHVPPALLGGIQPRMRVWREEVFGPVGLLRTFEEEDEALYLANDSVFGLGASVWTEDRTRALWFAEYLKAGTVAINGQVRSDPRLPFGGIRRSGFGRELGMEGLHAFCNIKTLITDA